MTTLLIHFYKDLVLLFQEEPPSKTCIYLFMDFMSPPTPVCVCLSVDMSTLAQVLRRLESLDVLSAGVPGSWAS